MTTIAFDGKTLAADCQTNMGSVALRTKKLRQFSNGHIGGASGPAGECEAVMDWYEAGAKFADFPKDEDDKWCDVGLLVGIDENHCVYYAASPYGSVIYDIMATGSGQDPALVLMRAGYDAVAAVEAVSKTMGCSGLGVDFLRLETTHIDAKTGVVTKVPV